MFLLLGLLLFSWLICSILFIPFIKLLYNLRFQRLKQKTLDAFDKRTPIFDKFHQKKAGTPVGGGILIILLTVILVPLTLILMRYFWAPVTSVYPFISEIKIILFTFLSFGMLGLLDDAKKTFVLPNAQFFGLRLRHKLLLEMVLAGIISWWLFAELHIGIFYIPVIGVLKLGFWFIPFAMMVIIAFANAYNITDGLDGLASGLLMIALVAFWVISASILDTPLSVFIAIWLGAIIAFLYFNIHPARIFLGDVGSLSFGATLSVVALILGKAPVLLVIGGVFILELLSSFVQLASKKYLQRKVFSAAPFHLWLQYNGWPEPKIVMRAWIVGIILAILGLWLALFKSTSGLL
jgi:phospho-N-acetylmuramoyl-pentapeptide-transferase